MPWRDDVFRPWAIQGAPDLNAAPNRLILDGQQRLSSLYQACYGAGEYRYFIALGPLMEDEDVEEAIFYRHKNRCGKYSTVEQHGYLLVPLAALWRDVIEVAGPASGANRDRLKTWFWCSGLSASYDRAANTQASRDYSELKRWIEGGEPPATVGEFEFEQSRMREITPKQQSIYKALMALIIQHGAPGLSPRADAHSDSILTQSVDDHHIFPRAYLNPSKEEPVYPVQLVDCILNRTMIDTPPTGESANGPPISIWARSAMSWKAPGQAASARSSSPICSRLTMTLRLWKRTSRLFSTGARRGLPTRSPLQSEFPSRGEEFRHESCRRGGRSCAGALVWIGAGDCPGTNGPIAFSSYGKIYTIQPDGSGLHQVVRTDEEHKEDFYPSWAPDGQRIVTTGKMRNPDGYWTDMGLPVFSPDGTGFEHLPIFGYVGAPAWSPDGATSSSPEKVGFSARPPTVRRPPPSRAIREDRLGRPMGVGSRLSVPPVST